MWVLETDLGFSGRAIHILNPGASPELLFLYFCLSKGVFCLWPSSDFSTDVFRLSTLHFKMEAVTSSCILSALPLDCSVSVFVCILSESHVVQDKQHVLQSMAAEGQKTHRTDHYSKWKETAKAAGYKRIPGLSPPTAVQDLMGDMGIFMRESGT